MARIDDMAKAALSREALTLRSISQDWLFENTLVGLSAAPTSEDPNIRNIAAGLVELFAERLGQLPPAWTHCVPCSHQPIFLIRATDTMLRLRSLCETESPAPLRRRNLFAPQPFWSSRKINREWEIENH